MSHAVSTSRAEVSVSAAELIAVRARARLERRIAWLAAAGEDLPEHEQTWGWSRPAGEEAAAAARLQGSEGQAWTRLIELFRLAPGEAELLELAVAVAAEPALGPLVARAQQAEGRLLPTEPLVKRLANLGPRPIWRPTGPLALWGLVRPVRFAPGEPPGFEADPRMVDWMFGSVSLDQQLVLAVDTPDAGPLPPEWPVKEAAARLERALKAGGQARLVVEARAGAGRRRFGAAVARALERKALIVDPAPLAPADWAEHFMRAQRFALYADVALVWREGAPAWPNKVPLAPIQIVCVEEGGAPPARDGVTDLVLALPEPGVASKAAIWRELAPHLAQADGRIATIPGLSLGDLEEASRAAPRSADEAGAHLRALARSRMQGAGRVVDPQFGWDDLMVPADLAAQLRRIAFEARARPTLLQDPESARLFAGTAGLSALFAGPPGVGKSMAAQVIARELGINLLIVDLAATTSKYVGETAKNLSLAFSRARAAGAALIFEEADALFARRTEVKDSNDRHANADTGHLLQLMEAHEGIVILSTNRRANIDPAFIRRLRHVVEFPRPGVSERRRLWERMLQVLGVRAEAVDGFDALAGRYELSPAQIKGAVLSARYGALAEMREVELADLDEGASRELAKEGRSAAPRAEPPARRARILTHG
jgi:hypothetical protein